MACIIDPDQTTHLEQIILSLHSALNYTCPNTKSRRQYLTELLYCSRSVCVYTVWSASPVWIIRINAESVVTAMVKL